MNAPDLEQHAAAVLKRHLERAAPALINPYSERLSEDYFVFHLRRTSANRRLPAGALRRLDRANRAGRARQVFSRRVAEILESQMSYYGTDSIAQLSDKSSSRRRPALFRRAAGHVFRASQQPP